MTTSLRILILTLVAVLGASSAAQAAVVMKTLPPAQGGLAVAGKVLPVFIECDLRNSDVDCQQLIRGFFALPAFSNSLKEVTHKSDAWVLLKLNAENDPHGDEILHFNWSSVENDTISVSEFKYDRILNSLWDPLTKLNKAIKYMSEVGTLYVAMAADSAGTNPSGPNQEGPWFTDISVYGSLNNQTETSSTNAGGLVSINYSVKKYRAALSAGSHYSKSSVSDGAGGKITAENMQKYFSVIGVKSFSKKWSVAIIAEMNSDPGSNIDSDAELTTGVEWNLVPFRTEEDDHEFVFRVGLTGKSMKLSERNVNGNTEEKFLNAFANAYLYWILLDGKAKVSLSATAQTNLKYKGFEKYSLGTNFTIQATKNLNVSTGVSYGYSARSITYPATPDYSNPLQFRLIGNQPGSSLNMNITLGLTLGKGSLRKDRDRRFVF